MLLPRPSSVQPWLILDETLKTNGCQNEYLWTPMETIYCEMFRNDPFRGTSVAPMALVGGKNTGKSKTLKDIAQMVNQNQTREIGVFYVSFGNDLEMSDGQDLLEAFCQRLVFCATAHWERIPTFESYHEAFSKFHKKNHNIIPWKIDKWLDGSHRILLIDDIDGIQKQLDANHTQAYKFGKFLKDNFVMNYGQYLVFSCQTDSAKEAFANILDTTSVQSSRTVHVQSLVQQKKTWD
ncbi:hypothetical protein MPSEU_000260000 [Mayamaea pseudoterrestris]|nr:hypothetical protein MPSEU_000260000 [Mayamaea pseudoterrestris]